MNKEFVNKMYHGDEEVDLYKKKYPAGNEYSHTFQKGKYLNRELYDEKGNVIYNSLDERVGKLEKLKDYIKQSVKIKDVRNKDDASSFLSGFKSIHERQWKPLHHVYSEDMTKQAFIKGFITRANYNGISITEQELNSWLIQ